MEPFQWSILALIGGFVVAVGTELLLGRKKARELPGGSLTAGIAAGTAAQAGFVPVVIGAGLGIVGWVIYRLAFRH